MQGKYTNAIADLLDNPSAALMCKIDDILTAYAHELRDVVSKASSESVEELTRRKFNEVLHEN
jgi:hypothetical protein